MPSPSHKNLRDITTFEAGLLQNRAYRALNNFLTHHLAKEGLTVPEWKLLGQLTLTDGQRLSQLAAILDVEPPYATRLVLSLEEKGLVARRSDTSDDRAKQVYLTPKGLSRAGDIEKTVRTAMRSFLADIDPEELAIYLGVLLKLARKL